MWLFLFGIVLAVWLWIVVKPAQLPAPPDHPLAQQIARGTERVRQTATSWIEKRGWPFPTTATDLPGRFQVWAVEHLPAQAAQLSPTESADFSAWLANRTDESLTAYVKGLTAFCEAFGLKLEALWDEHLGEAQHQVLVEVIGLYSLAQWQSAQARVAAMLTTWEMSPSQVPLPNVAQQLFAQLVSQHLTTLPPELLLASEAERQIFLRRSILQAAHKNPAEVRAVLNSLLSQSV